MPKVLFCMEFACFGCGFNEDDGWRYIGPAQDGKWYSYEIHFRMTDGAPVVEPDPETRHEVPPRDKACVRCGSCEHETAYPVAVWPRIMKDARTGNEQDLAKGFDPVE